MLLDQVVVTMGRGRDCMHVDADNFPFPPVFEALSLRCELLPYTVRKKSPLGWRDHCFTSHLASPLLYAHGCTCRMRQYGILLHARPCALHGNPSRRREEL